MIISTHIPHDILRCPQNFQKKQQNFYLFALSPTILFTLTSKQIRTVRSTFGFFSGTERFGILFSFPPFFCIFFFSFSSPHDLIGAQESITAKLLKHHNRSPQQRQEPNQIKSKQSFPTTTGTTTLGGKETRAFANGSTISPFINRVGVCFWLSVQPTTNSNRDIHRQLPASWVVST